jgi:hypothetical protein
MVCGGVWCGVWWWSVVAVVVVVVVVTDSITCVLRASTCAQTPACINKQSNDLWSIAHFIL